MCGYCTESFALRAMQHDQEIIALSRDKPMFATMAFQEAVDLPSGLLEIGDTCINNPSVALTILCRAIELLSTAGFDSEAYQRLIEIPNFKAAIRSACEYIPKTDTSSDLPEQLQPDHYQWLREISTYLEANCFRELSENASPQRCLENVLNYSAWWVDRAPTANDHRLLWQIFPMLWFSLLRSSKADDIEPAVWLVAIRARGSEPDFDALDLWLQRRAALVIYERRGIDPFVREIKLVRAELIGYLILTGRLSEIERQTLSDRIRQLPGGDLEGETTQFSARELLAKFPAPLLP